MVSKIKNLKFENITIIVLSMGKMARVLVRWDLEKTAQDLKDVYFDVYRGESPSEMTKINTTKLSALDVHEYVDNSVILLSINKNYYYKVIASEYFRGTPVKSFESEPMTWQGKLDLVSMYIVEEHLFAFRYIFGTPALLFKKKNEGVRCNNCWDSVLKRVTKSNCSVCYGTGFIGGYYKQSSHWMHFSPDPTTAQVADFGVREPSQCDVEFVNYPLLQMGDIILEVEPYRFWRVVNVRGAEKNRNTLLQIARIDEVNKSDIEQQLSVDHVERIKLLEELDERGKTPEF
jgi:formylmethanofuran dehydrogenase subunit E